MYTGSVATRPDTYREQLSAAWIPYAIGGAALVGIVGSAWALIKGEDRRRQTLLFYKSQMDMLVQYMSQGPYPKFLQAAKAFDIAQFDALQKALKSYNKKIFWASPTTSKINALLFTSLDGNAIVICDKARDIASIVATESGYVDWSKVRDLIQAAADNNPPKGWFSDKAAQKWMNQIYELQTEGTTITPIVQVVPKTEQSLSMIDVGLIALGAITIGILGYNLIKRQPRHSSEQTKVQLAPIASTLPVKA